MGLHCTRMDGPPELEGELQQLSCELPQVVDASPTLMLLLFELGLLPLWPLEGVLEPIVTGTVMGAAVIGAVMGAVTGTVMGAVMGAVTGRTSTGTETGAVIGAVTVPTTGTSLTGNTSPTGNTSVTAGRSLRICRAATVLFANGYGRAATHRASDRTRMVWGSILKASGWMDASAGGSGSGGSDDGGGGEGSEGGLYLRRP